MGFIFDKCSDGSESLSPARVQEGLRARLGVAADAQTQVETIGI
jgi:hypothetical protein